MSYYELNENLIPGYLWDLSFDQLGDPKNLKINEVGDGNLNYVYRIAETEGDRSFILKQAVPYIRCLGRDARFTEDRMLYEIAAIKKIACLAPDFTPKVINCDNSMRALIMEDLRDFQVMRNHLLAGQIRPALFAGLGRVLGKIAFQSSFYHNEEENKKAAADFRNIEMRCLTSRYIFSLPFYDSGSTIDFGALTASDVKSVWRDKNLKKTIGYYRHRFATANETFQHGDLHTGSLMIKGDCCKIIDYEFAFYGPIGFDLGLLAGNLILSAIGHSVAQKKSTKESKAAYRKKLLRALENFAKSALKEFSAIWRYPDDALASNAILEMEKQRMIDDMVAFGAIEMLRRILGVAKVADITTIKNPIGRRKAELAVIDLARELLTGKMVTAVEEFITIVKEFLEIRLPIKSEVEK